MTSGVQRRLLLVGNPTAQSGKAVQRIARARTLLVDAGFALDTLDTAPDGRTVALVKDALDETAYDVVVALGGDGTFAEVAKGVLRCERQVQMGFLPSGTGNDQGKSFGISAAEADMADGVRVIDDGHITALDVASVKKLDDDGNTVLTDTFFDSLGFGIQPEILKQRNKDRAFVQKIPFLRDVYRDQAVYAGATLAKYVESFFEPTKFDAEIIADGQELRFAGLTDVILKNTAVYGGAWILAREGEPDDGKLELIPMQGRRDWFSKILRDHQNVPVWQEDLDLLGVTHASGTSAAHFELRLHRPAREEIHAQLDGEEWASGKHFVVDVDKNALSLLTPAGFVPPWRP